MTLQSSVRIDMTTGINGEIIFDGPHRVRPLIVDSAGATPNTVGFAFTYNAAGDKVVAGSAGTGAFAGLLVHPKHYALQGTTAGTLEPTLDIPDDSNAELLTMGTIVVDITVFGAGAIGEGIFYVDATGALGCGTAIAGQTQIANAKIDRKAITGVGLAIITLTEGA